MSHGGEHQQAITPIR